MTNRIPGWKSTVTVAHYGDGSIVFGPPLRASKYDYHLVLEKFGLRVAGVVRDAESGEPLSGFEAAARMTSGERARGP